MNENTNENEINYDRLNKIQAELKKAREIERSLELLKRQQNMESNQGQSMGSNQSQSIGSNQAAKTLVKHSGKNPHYSGMQTPISEYQQNEDTSTFFNGGFINTLIMALLVGFAGGAIMTAIYIFIALGKVTVSI